MAGPWAVKKFLHFLYTDQLIDPKEQDAVELLVMAERYRLPKLKTECADHLAGCLDLANIAAVTEAAKAGNCPELLDKCQRLAVVDEKEKNNS